MASWADNVSTLYAGELEIRLGEGLVLATGRAVMLSVREFELLAAMAKRAGAIVTRGELYAEVWGGELRPGDRSVDVYVSKLRGKLETAMPDRRFIHTHPGFGYRFQPQPSRDPGTAAGSPGVTAGSTGVMAGAPGATAGSQTTAQHSDGVDDHPEAPSRNVYIGAVGDS